MATAPPISVILCTHNPRPEILGETLAALAAQRDFAAHVREVVLIDNASRKETQVDPALAAALKLRVVAEPKVGLTQARLRGFAETSGPIMLFVDDDNVLDPDYAGAVARSMVADPLLGAIGGKAIPRFETEPPPWFTIEEYSLGCRDLGDRPLRASWRGLGHKDRVYPACSPIGGGMAIRREAFAAYAAAIGGDGPRSLLDRRGASLSSGGDNDIVMCVLEQGLDVAYEPALRFTHLIPAGRLTLDYLRRYQHDSTRTWVQVLAIHDICPWPPLHPWTLPLRKLRAYLVSRAWRGPLEETRFHRRCGLFAGRASLHRRARGAR